MILKNLQDEISALRSENKLLRERVMELEKAVRHPVILPAKDAPNFGAAPTEDNSVTMGNSAFEESDASRMSDAIVHGLWKNVVNNKTEERYGSIQFQYPKAISSVPVPRFPSPRDTPSWTNVACNPANH